jgi:hypothetical protein
LGTTLILRNLSMATINGSRKFNRDLKEPLAEPGKRVYTRN